VSTVAQVPDSARGTAFIKLHCVVRLDQEVGRYVAGSSQLDVWSSGESEKEALDRAQEAILLFLDEATASGNVWEILKEAGIEVFRRKADIRPDTLPERLLHAFKGDAFPLEFSVAG